MTEESQHQTLPRTFRSLEEVRAACGETVGTSAYRTVSQEMVDGFADITADHEWLHVDLARAADGPFGTTIAHGFLTLSLLAGFAAEIFRLEVDVATMNYGLDRVRFISPLLTGSRVRARAAFESVEPHAAGHILRLDYMLEIEGETKPACVAQALLLMLSTPV